LDIPDLIHRVMARGIDGQNIFRSDEDRNAFLERLADRISRPGAPQLYAWALLSNHFHLLLRAGEGLLAPTMRSLMTGHAVTHNLRYKRQGHLFQNRYKSIVVEEEAYFQELVRYIHLNPVRAGIVKTPEELEYYPYTGHSVLLGKREYSAQDCETLLARFSARRKSAQDRYRRFVADRFGQGRREELRGGGLARSAGGLTKSLKDDRAERDLSDTRILGDGDFVATVLGHAGEAKASEDVSVETILKQLVEQTGISREQMFGPSRSRSVSSARRQFYFAAHEKAGATKTQLGKLTGRSHVAVMLAINQARAERNGAGGDE